MVVLVYHILYVCQRISLRADIHTYMRACMHTLHYTTLHYITLHYITSHHITYIHTNILVVPRKAVAEISKIGNL